VPWNPQAYEAFADHRMRPAIDLLNRVSLDAPRRVVDLGCGSGAVTLLLAARWPQAAILALDSSAEMLARARARSSSIEWRQVDLAAWRAAEPVDLVFSNAALHWLVDHVTLLPRLADAVAPGGVLAVQMPSNFAAPSHVLMHALALEAPYRPHLESVLRQTPVLEAQAYHALLAPRFGRIDLWSTEYLQVLTGDNPVADWTRSTWLGALLEALPGRLRGPFEAEYRRRVLQAYPKGDDGSTLFPFRRLFMVATDA
jgi:trans-aconitate 2-methyltransferase